MDTPYRDTLEDYCASAIHTYLLGCLQNGMSSKWDLLCRTVIDAGARKRLRVFLPGEIESLLNGGNRGGVDAIDDRAAAVVVGTHDSQQRHRTVEKLQTFRIEVEPSE